MMNISNEELELVMNELENGGNLFTTRQPGVCITRTIEQKIRAGHYDVVRFELSCPETPDTFE